MATAGSSTALLPVPDLPPKDGGRNEDLNWGRAGAAAIAGFKEGNP